METSRKHEFTGTTQEEREHYESEKAFRIKKAIIAWKMKRALEVNKRNREIMKLRKKHEELGLPWPPPPQPPQDKKSRKKRAETPKKTTNKTTISKRWSSAPRQRTEFSNAELQKNLQGQTWRAHDMVKGWRTDALAQVAKAEASASELAASAINARADLASIYNDEREAALRTISEAATRAEATLLTKKAYADKFASEQRMRASLARQSMAAMEAQHTKQTRINDDIIVGRFAREIFSYASEFQRHARRNANLDILYKKWSRIALIASSLEASAKDTNPEDTNSIIAHLGDARNLIENTSVDNEVVADQIKVFLDKAQNIAIKATISISTRTKAGSKRIRKHTRKHTRKYTKKHKKN